MLSIGQEQIMLLRRFLGIDYEDQYEKDRLAVDNFWLGRNKQAGKMGLVLTISNIFFQGNAIIYPLNESHKLINEIYMINSVACLIAFALSFTKKVNLFFPAIYLTSFR